MSEQTKITDLLPISKFYKNKTEIAQDFTNFTVLKGSNDRYTPTVKKIAELSSSSESDSDSDTENNHRNVKRSPKRTHKIENGDSSPSKKQKQSKKKGLSKKQRAETNPLKVLQSKSSRKENIKHVSKQLFTDKYQVARKALHSSAPENLPTRETEINELVEFISEHVNCRSSGSLYISGPPGTGKTACLSQIIKRPTYRNKLKSVFINCTTIKSANSIYMEIVRELGIEMPKLNRNCKFAVEKHLSMTKKMILLVLDEIDQLTCKNQAVLYSIFEWPLQPKSKLILIGISNALDLTDRILPRLQARPEIKPQLMNFTPYTNEQIVEIISDRLRQAEVMDVFTPMALQLLARKVSAISGDIRKALDISRRVIKLVESRKNNENNESSSNVEIQVETKVDIKDVLAIVQAIYGGSQNIDAEETTFPLQQKLLLCSLMLILQKGKSKDVTIGRLYEVYRKVCIKRNINVLDDSELVNLCHLIEDRGILHVIAKKDSRQSKVALQWDLNQLIAALSDKNLISDIADDVSCL